LQNQIGGWGLTPTILTPEEQAAILYWPYTAYIGIIQADSKNKIVGVNNWPNLELNNEDFRANLEAGLYDNGIAIRLGKCLNGNGNYQKPLYTIALDFDGWATVEKFYENWDHVLNTSKKTRVEWHKDKSKIHVIFLANRPIAYREIKIKDSQLEIRCENKLLFVSPSFHPDGNRWEALGTEEILILNEKQLLQLEATIEVNSEGQSTTYMSDSNKQAYLKALENPNFRLYEGQGRHVALTLLGASYFNRHTWEWRNLTDDQRKAKLWQWNVEHCDPPKPELEFNQIWDWIVKTFRRSRDEKWEQEEEILRANYPSTLAAKVPELNGNIFYQTNTRPPKFIVAHSNTKRLIEVTIKTKETKSGSKTGGSEQIIRKQTIGVRPFLACIPVKVILHKSPIEHLIKGNGDKYTIHFVGAQKSGCRIIKHKTIAEIVTELKESGNVMADFGVEIALSMILKEFERKGLVEENTDMEISGFFHNESGGLFTSNIPDKDLAQPTREELEDALKAVDELKKFYENRLELLADLIKWALAAPLSFVIKTSHLRYVIWLVLWGASKTLKSNSGRVILAIDRHHNYDSGFIKSQGSIDSVARLGETVSKTTFPIVVNEVNLIDDRMRHILEYMKTAVESPIFREKFTNSHSKSITRYPALSALFLSSNFALPVYNTAFMSRIKERYHSKSEVHKPDEPISKEFDTTIQNILDRLGALGQFRNWFVINNPYYISEEDLGLALILKIYEHLGIMMPEWLKLKISENQLEESLSDSKIEVKRAFEAYITNSYDRALPFWRFEKTEGVELAKETSSRLSDLIDNNRLPDIKRQKSEPKIIMIYKGILQELYRLGVTKDQIPNLVALADYMSARYDRDPNGHWIVKAGWLEIEKYFS
jgi:hypothetical protein